MKNTILRLVLLGTPLMAAGYGGRASQSAAPAPQAPATAQADTRVDALIARQMEMRRIPGLSLGVVKNGELILAKGFGNATLEWKAPATPETVYLLASMTKQFTATAIMMLAAENRLKLDDPIASYVPGAPESWSSITLRHLLTHTAGLKDRFELMNGRMFMDYSTPQMLDAALRTPVDAPPGTKWQYSDQGYFLLGVVIEKASGLSYGQFLRDRVFGPLGMTSTSLEKLNGHREIYHAGSTGTCLYRLPDDGVSTIVLTNLEQVSGSDPCLIARAVAAQYVPEIAIVSVPARDDPDPARSKRLRSAVEAYGKGQLDPALYTAEAYRVISALVPSQQAGFEQLGPIQSFQLVADDTLISQVVRYRVRYAQTTLHFRFVLDQAGKIASMTAR